MKKELEELAKMNFPNPFSQDTEFKQWNDFDIASADFQNAVQVMRNLLCDCTRPRRTEKQLDSMVQKIRDAN
jgi:hypothetical protein